MARLALLVLVLPACLGGLTTGAVAPVGGPTGVELRVFGATGGIDGNPLMPNAYGVAYRQIGDEHAQTAGQIGWAGAVRVGPGAVFGRLMFDAINTQRTMDGDRKYSAFSPTLDLGVVPVKNGLCVSASATYDVQFNEPDRWIVGVFAGVCGSDRKR